LDVIVVNQIPFVELFVNFEPGFNFHDICCVSKFEQEIVGLATVKVRRKGRVSGNIEIN